jgi:hypothetical protein
MHQLASYIPTAFHHRLLISEALRESGSFDQHRSSSPITCGIQFFSQRTGMPEANTRQSVKMLSPFGVNAIRPSTISARPSKLSWADRGDAPEIATPDDRSRIFEAHGISMLSWRQVLRRKYFN